MDSAMEDNVEASQEAGLEEDAEIEQDAAVLDAGVDSAVAVDAAVDAQVVVPDAAPDAAPPSCVLTTVDVMDMCPGDIVINEIDGSGNDFVEIYNRGTQAINISNWIIADDSGGNPDIAKGALIPAGTVIEPKRFVYLWANLAPETEPNTGKFYSECIPGSPPPCLHSEWGVTAGGERIFLVDDQLTVVCAVSYPNAVYGGESFGRIPDGSSMLCPSNPSPGELNVVSTLR